MPLNPDTLTWTALLGRWMDFARASVALPDDARGEAWKQSVPPIIELQAVTFALGEINDLPEDERSVALDKSEVIIDRADQTLESAWSERGKPEAVAEILRDARLALKAASKVGEAE